MIKVDGHRFYTDSNAGKEYYDIFREREELEIELQIYEAIWRAHFKSEPLKECTPCKVKRYITVNTNEKVLMDKAFFDSLKNDDNTRYQKYNSNFFNGTYYRSAAERDIAIFYTEMGIPFKYEPSIIIAGLTKPINPDFVLYFRELDSCKIHEHLGMKNFADYIRDFKVKSSNYIGAGLLPGMDVLFTFDTDDTPFDYRILPVKINCSVYESIACRPPEN